jgi:hypothetical protein
MKLAIQFFGSLAFWVEVIKQYQPRKILVL